MKPECSSQGACRPRFAALWLPRFQLQALLREQPLPCKSPPLAVLDVDPSAASVAGEVSLVLTADARAEQAGVRAGMTASQALARCGSLLLLQRNAEVELETQRLLLQHAGTWSAECESTRPGLCVVDLTRAPILKPDPLTAAHKMRTVLHGSALDARIGFARNADLACLAAHAADTVLALHEAADEKALLDCLPVSVLHPSANAEVVLHLWGIRTFGELARLRRTDVGERLGVEGLHLWDMAAGGGTRLLTLLRPATSYREELDLEHPLETLEPLLFLLRRMLELLCLRLAEQWLAASSQHLRLRFEDGSTHEHTLRAAEPTRDADVLLRVLQTHLDGIQATAPVIALALELTPVRPVGRQGSLFERSLRDPNRFAETLSQLEAMLGRGNVGCVHLLPSRRPDAFRLINPVEQENAVNLKVVSPQSHPHGLPLRRFRPPQPVNAGPGHGPPQWLEIKQKRLGVLAARGPWLLSGDWWEPTAAWEREVWEVQVQGGVIYQLARERSGWVLDGVLG